jgi:hypothetical protein
MVIADLILDDTVPAMQFKTQEDWDVPRLGETRISAVNSAVVLSFKNSNSN